MHARVVLIDDRKLHPGQFATMQTQLADPGQRIGDADHLHAAHLLVRTANYLSVHQHRKRGPTQWSGDSNAHTDRYVLAEQVEQFCKR